MLRFRLHLDPFEPKLFLTNFMQLLTYVIAAGCLSFSTKSFNPPLDLVKSEHEVFWNLVLDGVSRLPGIYGLFLGSVFDLGGNPETFCTLLDDLSHQSIEDSETDAGRLLPTILVVGSLLINCTQFSVKEDKISVNQG